MQFIPTTEWRKEKGTLCEYLKKNLSFVHQKCDDDGATIDGIVFQPIFNSTLSKSDDRNSREDSKAKIPIPIHITSATTHVDLFGLLDMKCKTLSKTEKEGINVFYEYGLPLPSLKCNIFPKHRAKIYVYEYHVFKTLLFDDVTTAGEAMALLCNDLRLTYNDARHTSYYLLRSVFHCAPQECSQTYDASFGPSFGYLLADVEAQRQKPQLSQMDLSQHEIIPVDSPLLRYADACDTDKWDKNVLIFIPYLRYQELLQKIPLQSRPLFGSNPLLALSIGDSSTEKKLFSHSTERLQYTTSDEDTEEEDEDDDTDDTDDTDDNDSENEENKINDNKEEDNENKNNKEEEEIDVNKKEKRNIDTFANDKKSSNFNYAKKEIIKETLDTTQNEESVVVADGNYGELSPSPTSIGKEGSLSENVSLTFDNFAHKIVLAKEAHEDISAQQGARRGEPREKLLERQISLPLQLQETSLPTNQIACPSGKTEQAVLSSSLTTTTDFRHHTKAKEIMETEGPVGAVHPRRSTILLSVLLPFSDKYSNFYLDAALSVREASLIVVKHLESIGLIDSSRSYAFYKLPQPPAASDTARSTKASVPQTGGLSSIAHSQDARLVSPVPSALQPVSALTSALSPKRQIASPKPLAGSPGLPPAAASPSFGCSAARGEWLDASYPLVFFCPPTSSQLTVELRELVRPTVAIVVTGTAYTARVVIDEHAKEAVRDEARETRQLGTDFVVPIFGKNAIVGDIATQVRSILAASLRKKSVGPVYKMQFAFHKKEQFDREYFLIHDESLFVQPLEHLSDSKVICDPKQNIWTLNLHEDVFILILFILIFILFYSILLLILFYYH